MNDTDYFALFGLPRVFELDLQQLEQSWKRVALTVHPDRYVTASPAERRVAMQWSTRANEAYRVLREPLLRARYLCELAGVDLQTETNTAMSSEFLLQQMQWHEQLDQINDDADEAMRLALKTELAARQADVIAQCGRLFAEQAFVQAAEKIREWMFVEKLLSQVSTSSLVT